MHPNCFNVYLEDKGYTIPQKHNMHVLSCFSACFNTLSTICSNALGSKESCTLVFRSVWLKRMQCPSCGNFLTTGTGICKVCQTINRLQAYSRGLRFLPYQEEALLTLLRGSIGALTDFSEEAAAVINSTPGTGSGGGFVPQNNSSGHRGPPPGSRREDGSEKGKGKGKAGEVKEEDLEDKTPEAPRRTSEERPEAREDTESDSSDSEEEEEAADSPGRGPGGDNPGPGGSATAASEAAPIGAPVAPDAGTTAPIAPIATGGGTCAISAGEDIGLRTLPKSLSKSSDHDGGRKPLPVAPPNRPPGRFKDYDRDRSRSKRKGKKSKGKKKRERGRKFREERDKEKEDRDKKDQWRRKER